MMTTLSLLQTRVRALLMDATEQVWSADTLTESIRLALGEYALAGQSAVTLTDLDGATSTTLNSLHDSLIVWGAAAYAALSRAVDRAESYQLGGEAAQLKAWGDQRLAEFKTMLGYTFPNYRLVNAGAAAGAASGADPAKLAAETALLNAQVQHITGEESRAAAAAQTAAADRAAEANRLAGLHGAASAPWGSWRELSEPNDPDNIIYN